MKHVSLQSIDLLHFKSFVSAHIDLHRSSGFRMIFGENRKEPRLGANGAGKSTIWDAICFCLSGRSVRGKRASELVTTGHKTTSVTTTWRIDNTVRTIERSGPPERIRIDGETATQEQVDELMGLSRDRFLSSVIFGQAKPLFIDLPVPERGDLLDQVLGLGFWMQAADLATSKWNKAGVEMQSLQREIARLDGALSELPTDESLTQAADDYEVHREQQLAELQEQRKAFDTEYRNVRRALSAMQKDVDALEERRKHRDGLRERASKIASEVAVLQSVLDRVERDIKFVDETEECPTCGQEISEELATEHMGHLEQERREQSDLWAAAERRVNEVNGLISLDDAKIKSLVDKTKDQHRLSLSVGDKKGQISTIDNRLALIANQINPYDEQLQAASRRRTELNDKLTEKRRDESILSMQMTQLDFWRQGFRRVRIFCLTRVLAELEVETMSAARSLGLVGWSIKFVGETEMKSGSVKLGIRAVVESPEAKRDFDAWSPGEGQRIRCASAIGLGSLIQRYSGVSYDLEVWDEPSAWLSAEGIGDLFECLRERAHDRGKSVWVCDPRAGLSHGGFDEVWNIVKDDNGSRVEIARIAA